MKAFPSLAQSDRLAALRGYGVLDTPPEKSFDALAMLAAQVCGAPVARITLVDERRQWFKAEIGTKLRETPVENSICAHLLGGPDTLVVRDLREDPRFSEHVGGPLEFRFYAGAVLKTAEGHALGALAVLDFQPRTLTPDQLAGLKALAGQVMDQLELRRAQSAVKAAQAQWSVTSSLLADADRRKDEYLASLAHELRNPLAPIRTVVEVLMRADSDDKTIVWAREILNRQTESLGRLVDDLLDMSRMSHGKLQLKIDDVNLDTMVARALETSRPLIDRRKHVVDLNLPREPIKIRGDEIRLAQILSNLLNNAAKYMAVGGRIRIDAACAAGKVTINVTDHGVGIARHDLERIFDLFAQTGETMESGEGGLGLGLTLARKLALLHGGELSASSMGPGTGSRFSLTLPASAGRIEPQGAQDIATERGGMRPMRILIIDDNVDAAESLQMLLGIWGNEVETAFDGATALAMAEEFAPEVVLCDIGLPVMDGFEVVARMKAAQKGPRQPVYAAITGYGQNQDKAKAMAAGFDYHLTKPVDLDMLESMLALIAMR